MTKRKNTDLGVLWFETPESKRPFVTTTVSDSDLIETCDYMTPYEMMALPYISCEVKEILTFWIGAGKGGNSIGEILVFKA